jgi:hypothetical protein
MDTPDMFQAFTKRGKYSKTKHLIIKIQNYLYERRYRANPISPSKTNQANHYISR